MTETQKKIASYVIGSAGTHYVMSNFAKACLFGMLETGEATPDDFRRAVNEGEMWLAELRRWGDERGLDWPCK